MWPPNKCTKRKRRKIKAVIKDAQQTPLQGIIAALEGMKIRENREVLLHFTPFKKMFILGKKDPVLDSLINQIKSNYMENVEIDQFIEFDKAKEKSKVW